MSETEESLQAVIELANIGFWSMDVSSSALKLSTRAKRSLGMRENDCIGYREILRAIHAEDRHKTCRLIQMSLDSKHESFAVEFRVHGIHDGIERTIAAIGRVKFNDQSIPVRIDGASRDITQERQVESRLRSACEVAESACRLKTEFLANMSREIRTPLGIIIGFADLALEEPQSWLEREAWIRKIRDNGERVLKLVNDLLDLSKSEDQQMEFRKMEPISLFDFLADLELTMVLPAKNKGLQMAIEVDGKVPNLIKTDWMRLRQIMINLVGNAIKFTSKGEVRLTVRLGRTQEVGKHVHLQFVVTDTGPGLSVEQQNKLFKPALQSVSQMTFATPREYRGAGLGLYLSRKLAHAMGGDIYLADSSPLKGSTFVFEVECEVPELEHGSVDLIGSPSFKRRFAKPKSIHLSSRP